MQEEKQPLPEPEVQVGALPGRKDFIVLKLTLPVRIDNAETAFQQLGFLLQQVRTGIILPGVIEGGEDGGKSNKP